MRVRVLTPFCAAALIFAITELKAAPTTVCDLFRDLKSYNGRGVKLEAELFLDKNLTVTAANCDQDFVEESFVWSTALHLDQGPSLTQEDSSHLEEARKQAVEGRQKGKHIRITATLEGTVTTKDQYSWSSNGQGTRGNAFGASGRFPARILLDRISEIKLEVLPDAEDLPVLDVCEILPNLTAFDGKRVAIRGEIVSGYHGSAIRGADCTQTFETDGYKWPSALDLTTVRFNDSELVRSLDSDRKRSAATDMAASKVIRGRQNIRRIYTTVGIVRTRQRFRVRCQAGGRLGGNGFGEMGFAPAEFFVETTLNAVIEQRPISDGASEETPCPPPKRLPSQDCSAMDLAAAADGGCLDRVRGLAAIRPLDGASAALVTAATNGYADIVEALVKGGVSPTVPSDEKLPLCEAIENGRTGVVETLLAVGAKVDNRAESRCSLLGAALHGDPKMIELLAQHGANLELRDYFGATPLMIAVRHGKLANFHSLLKAGADIHAADGNGRTVLGHSTFYREIVLTLLKRGVNSDVPDADGMTPLMSAAWESRDEIVRILLEAGASVNRQDRSGDSALHRAMRSGHTDAIPVLLKFGADPTLRNKEGKSPLDLSHGYQSEALKLRP